MRLINALFNAVKEIAELFAVTAGALVYGMTRIMKKLIIISIILIPGMTWLGVSVVGVSFAEALEIGIGLTLVIVILAHGQLMLLTLFISFWVFVIIVFIHWIALYIGLKMGIYINVRGWTDFITISISLVSVYAILFILHWIEFFLLPKNADQSDFQEHYEPEKEKNEREWMSSNEAAARAFLELPTSGKLDSKQILLAHRRMRQRHHPDKGGKAEDFIRVKWAFDILTKRK